jgi:hypothetical protein
MQPEAFFRVVTMDRSSFEDRVLALLERDKIRFCVIGGQGVMPVARVEDVFRGKTWAALDPTRRPSKRQKDLADIARLIESFPSLRDQTPPRILDRLEKP